MLQQLIKFGVVGVIAAFVDVGVLVVLKELVPESEKDGGYFASLGALLGFSCMMMLDVALG